VLIHGRRASPLVGLVIGGGIIAAIINAIIGAVIALLVIGLFKK
jgi:uncharacterized membrane protein YeaQ/YmgE (transglycosylase-associated protein family)